MNPGSSGVIKAGKSGYQGAKKRHDVFDYRSRPMPQRVIRTTEWHEMRITSLRAMVAIRPTRKNRRKLKLAIRRASVRA